MTYGELVQPIFLADLGWRFVISDTHDIARRASEEFPGTKIVGKPDTGDLAVAVWVPRDKLGNGDRMDDTMRQPVQNAGGAWVLSFALRDPSTGQPRRHLEADVLEELRRKDAHRRRRGVNPRAMYNELLKAHEVREARRLRRMRDRNLAMTEEIMFAAARRARVPWNPSRIYVSSGVNGHGNSR